MTQKRFVFIVGLPGTGKTTLSERLAEVLSSGVLNSGDALRKFLRRNGVPLERIIETGHVFLSEFGEEAVGPAILDEAQAMGTRIIDGPRLFSTLTHFQSTGFIVDVVHLTADDRLRRTRFRARSILEGEAGPDDVDRLLARKDEWSGDLEKFASVSRWRYDNSGSRQALNKFADSISVDLGGSF